jgi:hypothetical protein
MPAPEYPTAESDLHLTKPAPAIGGGSYQTGTAPLTASQKVGNLRAAAKVQAARTGKQKIKSYAPGSDPSIKGRTSFSDEQGD